MLWGWAVAESIDGLALEKDSQIVGRAWLGCGHVDRTCSQDCWLDSEVATLRSRSPATDALLLLVSERYAGHGICREMVCPPPHPLFE